MRLHDRAAIITGAGSGLGLGIAKLFASEGAGVMIAEIDGASGREAARSISESGGNARFFRTDTRDETNIREMVDYSVGEFGSIDILVNNAGVGLPKLIPDIAEEEWNNLHAVNLKGYFLCAKHVIPHMRQRGGGSIINISSIQAFAPQASFSAYAATKGGIVSMTKGIAMDYGRDFIRANAICPGMVMTPTTDRILHQTGEFEKMVNGTLAIQCIPRMGEEIDIAHLAVFLASSESSFITGQAIVIDGGASVGLKIPA